MTNIEYKDSKENYEKFFERIKDKSVAVMYDINTKPFAQKIIEKISPLTKNVGMIEFMDKELIPDEIKCAEAFKKASKYDYLLAVGSGTLNDMAKDVSTKLDIECGVLATAPSMDGYLSKGAALMIGGKKVTTVVHMPSDVLIDPDIIKKAPRLMIASGFGDIMGKYTCLTDWKLAHFVNGEEINKIAFSHMQDALTECVESFDGLCRGEDAAIGKLMNALLTAGLSMAECGNSRPASGSEHHMSHYLETDFIARNEKVPLHGVKVAIGTLISLDIYRYLKENDVVFQGSNEMYEIVGELPSSDEIKLMLKKLGCPVRFSEINVRESVMKAMLKNAYTVRDRYTVLTLVHNLGLTEKLMPLLMSKYY